MADPIIKIKRKTSASGKPTNLTVGELAVNLVDNAFYIHTGAEAITFGCEVDTNITLASNSDNKIPTQKAVKSYVDNFNTGSAFQSAARTSGTNVQSIANNTNVRVLFNNESFNTTSLTFAGGTFTNNTGTTMYVNVSYQVAFSSSNVGYRASWIQTSGDPTQSKYGAMFTTTNGATAQINNGSSVIPVSGNNGQFAIYAAQNSGIALTIGHASDPVRQSKVDIFKFS